MKIYDVAFSVSGQVRIRANDDIEAEEKIKALYTEGNLDFAEETFEIWDMAEEEVEEEEDE